jgi:UDP-N-acetylglucosamine:LPS N-acetylglucosamine transferase
MQTERGRVLLVGSSGGHLAQLMALRPWWQDRDRTWVTFRTPDATGLLADEDDVVWAHHPTTRNVPNLVRNTRLAWQVMRSPQRQDTDVVVSTGAAVAVPFFLIARLMGVRTGFIEVYDRIDSATLTGRLCRRFASVVIVQWDEQTRLYPEAHVSGPLL